MRYKFIFQIISSMILGLLITNLHNEIILYYNYILSFLLVWITNDGMLTAYDLKASEKNIEHLNEIIKDLILMKNSDCQDIFKKIKDNEKIMNDIKIKITIIHEQLNNFTLLNKKVSRSLDHDMIFNLDLFTPNIIKDP